MRNDISRVSMVAVFVFFASASMCCGNPWISSHGKHVAFHADHSRTTLSVWELATGREVCRIIDSHQMDSDDRDPPVIRACAIADEAGLVATVTEVSMSVWDLHTGELLWANVKSEKDFEGIESIAFYPDGKHMVTSGSIGKLKVRRSKDGTEPVEFAETGTQDHPVVQVSPAGDRIYSASRNAEGRIVLRCWDGEDGSVLGDFISEGDSVFDRNQFAVGSEVVVEIGHSNDKQLIVWDAKKFTEIRRVKIPRFEMYHSQPILFPTRGSVFLEGVEYDLNTGEVISKHVFGDGLLPSSLYDSSILAIPGTSLCCWTNASDRRVLFLGHLHPPSSRNYELSFQALKERRESAVICAGLPRGVVTGKPTYVEVFKDENAKVKGSAKERWRYERVPPSAVQPNQAAVTESLNKLLTPLPGRGNNLVDRSKPRLFVFAVGVSDYQLDEYDLQFAAKDARELASTLKKEHGGLFGDVQVTLLTDNQVTPAALRDGLNWLKRSSTDSDLVIVFFAGHGIRAKKGLYYFTHLGDEENIQNTCVNWSEIAQGLTAIRAKHILFLSDCCHAGSFSRERYLTQDKLAESISQVQHLSILAASTGEESSFEGPKLQHGAFTYALLEGLRGKSDSNGDQQISLRELEAYVRQRVPALTDDKQHPELFKTTEAGLGIIVGRSQANGVTPIISQP